VAKHRNRRSAFTQVVLTIVAAFLAVPLVHAAFMAISSHEVDRTSAAFRARDEALAKARVFVSSAPDIASLDLRTSPNDARPVAPDQLIHEWRVVS